MVCCCNSRTTVETAWHRTRPPSTQHTRVQIAALFFFLGARGPITVMLCCLLILPCTAGVAVGSTRAPHTELIFL